MNVLWIPIFSMRSYETGNYSILKDGNFQLSIARLLATDFDQITVCVPDANADYEDVLSKFMPAVEAGKLRFKWMKYGKNAVETRETFWALNAEALSKHDERWDLVVSDITGYTGPLPVIYNFNITKLPELDRPYIDKFFEQDLASIEQSLFTTVLNPRQREYILEVRPDLMDKVIVHTKCASELLLPPAKPADDPITLFWPFRLSDKAYKWDEFLVVFKAMDLHRDFKIYVTDPNESVQDLPDFVIKIKPTKDEYYKILARRPMVVMLDDIDTVLHPGTIEFFHYGCPVICFEADLLPSPNSIRNLGELASALHYPVYNKPAELSRFIYAKDEVDEYYNKEFVSVRQN